MNRRRVWITGAGGLIGGYLARLAPQLAPGWSVAALVREQLDLCDSVALQNAFRSDPPEVVIHCAAISRNTECQSEPARAWRVNCQLTKELADLAANAQLVFLSTDLVFDGRAGNYDEGAPVNPLTIYAETKGAAEKLVLANPKHLVVRTSLNGGTSTTGDRGFNEQLRRAWQRGERPRLFTDEFRSPIPACATVRAIWELVVQERAGLFHVAGAERLSRWQIGQIVAARWPDLNPKLEPGSIRDSPGLPRGPDTSLNCGKVQKLLSFPLPGLTQWLEAHPNERF